MNHTEHEEYLEQLWHMRENRQDSVDDLASGFHGDFNPSVLEKMAEEGWIELNDDKKRVVLTSRGQDHAREITRRHRLAERLLFDVLGRGHDQFEAEACEFEHIVAPELVDGICILLGHPRECPHGKSIPEGECCKKSLRHVKHAPRPLSQLKVSDVARVAFLKSERDDQIHRLEGLNIRPGAMLKLHQTYPFYVVECEGASIALEEKVAANILVWMENGETAG